MAEMTEVAHVRLIQSGDIQVYGYCSGSMYNCLVSDKSARDSLRADLWLCTLIGALFLKQFAEYRINILLIANMLHGEVIERRLQMFILTP